MSGKQPYLADQVESEVALIVIENIEKEKKINKSSFELFRKLKMMIIDDKSYDVIKLYFRYFIYSSAVCLSAIFIADQISNTFFVSKSFMWYIKIFTYILSGMVLCNISNWAFQTWSGNQPHEKLNKNLFLLLSLLSLFLAVLTVTLEYKI